MACHHRTRITVDALAGGEGMALLKVKLSLPVEAAEDEEGEPEL
jgi:hypothetical protein